MAAQEINDLDLRAFAQFVEWAYAKPEHPLIVVKSHWSYNAELPMDLRNKLTKDYFPLAAGSGGTSIIKTRLEDAGTTYDVVLKCAFAEKNPVKVAKMLAQEIKIWRLLKHPNVVPFLGISMGHWVDSMFMDESFDSQVPALVSLYCDQGTITSYLAENQGTLRMPLIMDVAAAVEYLHSNNIVHGDVKPGNILIKSLENGVCAAITDFGCSRIIGDDSFEKVDVLSHRYAAPEMESCMDETHYFTTAADVFSFAVTALEVITGKAAFGDGSPEMAALHFLEGRRPQRADHPAQEMTDGLWTLLEECWSKEASSRPTISDIIARLA
ncbi:hypothetical protein PLEOSDRAFT_1084387 [Pleurotus ostreatus PC15]|uniref:Protein kinase domain-containing protein n=1 Tax=Pleurotus ostreatus (strain PC15) TaxID=1137138 RepID=A0A067NQY2_PLEO1|nr:hypothetical protein PLEOSDRAFT_1084387 [Pleurotus ostreatus PC15]